MDLNRVSLEPLARNNQILFIWGIIGYIAGIGCLILAFVRFFQLKLMTEARKKAIDSQYILQEKDEQEEDNGISQRFKSKKKSLEGENFYIGEGALLFDNAFIPLDSISKVELVETKFKLSILWILIGVAGIVLIWSKEYRLVIYGIIMLLLCICKIYFDYDEHKKSKRLRIVTHSGEPKEMFHENTNFLESVVGVIRNAIRDGKGITYIAMDKAVINTGETTIDMKNLNNSNIYTNSTVYHGDNSGNVKNYNYTGNTININSGQIESDEITEGEWKQVEDFFSRCALFAIDDDEYRDVYINIGRFAVNRNIAGIKNYVRTVGTVVINGALKGKNDRDKIVPLLNRILKKK